LLYKASVEQSLLISEKPFLRINANLKLVRHKFFRQMNSKYFKRYKLMVKDGVFVDRRDAGFELAKLLEPDYKDCNPLVLGIPRGGVEVAYEVAKVLKGELSVIITKKLPHPFQEELAVGAIAEDGSIYLTMHGKNLSEQTINNIIRNQSIEIKRRIQLFRKSEPLPEMKDRIVIIVDDGIATGSTIIPAIKLCKHKGAAKVIVASPVSGRNYVSEINTMADDVVIVEQPEYFYAVGQVYEDFHHLSNEEVISLLEDFQ
jgi:putative phosphoribosyl transferase